MLIFFFFERPLKQVSSPGVSDALVALMPCFQPATRFPAITGTLLAAESELELFRFLPTYATSSAGYCTE